MGVAKGGREGGEGGWGRERERTQRRDGVKFKSGY